MSVIHIILDGHWVINSIDILVSYRQCVDFSLLSSLSLDHFLLLMNLLLMQFPILLTRSILINEIIDQLLIVLVKLISSVATHLLLNDGLVLDLVVSGLISLMVWLLLLCNGSLLL